MEINNQTDIAYLVYLCATWVLQNVELAPNEESLFSKIHDKACTEMRKE